MTNTLTLYTCLKLADWLDALLTEPVTTPPTFTFTAVSTASEAR